jgi:Mn-dependent DtxR family transcriptional regulator
MTVETVLTTMPIDIETFTESDDEELTGVTNAERVARFLYENDDKAFTPSEIAEATGVKKTSIGTVLRRLRERDLLEHKGDYWAIGDEETVRDAFRFHRDMDALDERFGAEDLDEWREHAATNRSE